MAASRFQRLTMYLLMAGAMLASRPALAALRGTWFTT